jgi:beta-lactamase class D
VPLDPFSTPVQAIESTLASQIASQHTNLDFALWGKTDVIAPTNSEALTWFLGGTLPGGNDTPYALALVLEENNPALAKQIGEEVLRSLSGVVK